MSAFELIRTETASDMDSNKKAAVKRMCRLLEVSRSGYYDYLNRQTGSAPEREERLLAMSSQGRHGPKACRMPALTGALCALCNHGLAGSLSDARGDGQMRARSVT